MFDNIEPFVSFNRVEIDVDSIPDQSVTLEQYKTVRANTPGFEKLYQKLNPEAFEHVVHHFIANSTRPDPGTYDGAMQYVLIPEMLKRLREVG